MDNKKNSMNLLLEFIPYDKPKFDAYTPFSILSDPEKLKKIDILLGETENYAPNKSSEYYEYYEQYDHTFDYIRTGSAMKESAITNLRKTKQWILEGKDTKDLEMSMVDCYDLNYSCLAMFKEDWLVEPRLVFSEDFFNVVFPEERELLFNYFLYDNAPGYFYHLPLLNKLIKSTEEDGTIKPHYINVEKARYLLNKMIDFRPENDFLKIEAKLFESLLIQVINKEIILRINNYNI